MVFPHPIWFIMYRALAAPNLKNNDKRSTETSLLHTPGSYRFLFYQSLFLFLLSCNVLFLNFIIWRSSQLCLQQLEVACVELVSAYTLPTIPAICGSNFLSVKAVILFPLWHFVHQETSKTLE